MIDQNHDIVPTLRMFDGLVMGQAADEIERLRAELSEARAATERATPKWRPIETAPKDGTRVLLAIDHGEHGDKVWTGLWADGWIVSYGKPQNSPTHWMPLPPSPAIRQGGAG